MKLESTIKPEDFNPRTHSIYCQSTTGRVHRQGCHHLRVGRSAVRQFIRPNTDNIVEEVGAESCCQDCFSQAKAELADRPAAPASSNPDNNACTGKPVAGTTDWALRSPRATCSDCGKFVSVGRGTGKLRRHFKPGTPGVEEEHTAEELAEAAEYLEARKLKSRREFAVVAAHPWHSEDCSDCLELFYLAVTHARVSGSSRTTYSEGGHSCTVARMFENAEGVTVVRPAK